MIELDNLRIAVAWSLDRGDQTDRELAIRIVAGLSNEANAAPASASVRGPSVPSPSSTRRPPSAGQRC